MIDQNSLQGIRDELDIQRVLSEYCLRLEINDFEQWLDLFTDDAVYEVHRKSLRGREEIAAVLSLAPHGVHIGGAVRIDRVATQRRLYRTTCSLATKTSSRTMAGTIERLSAPMRDGKFHIQL